VQKSTRWFVFSIAIALLAALLFTAFGSQQPSSAETSQYQHWRTWVTASLSCVIFILTAWFLKSFVLTHLPTEGEARENSLVDIYAFAYTFTLLSFALLVFPFGNILSEKSIPDTGPIRLLRGCVESLPQAGNRITSAVGPATAALGAASTASAADRVALPTELPTPAASTPGPTGAPSGRLPATPAGALTGSTINPATVTSEAPAGRAVTPEAYAKSMWPKGVPNCGENSNDVFTVLVSIGGAIGRADPPIDRKQGNDAVYRVREGFVVPLYIVVLAMVGAAVNLTRRLPEFQKRTHLDYRGTEKEPSLHPFEAREFVVFQILQLIAAPFIAMVAFYAIAPQSIESAVALAFVSGFFSEGILLRIRSLVEGPDKTQVVASRHAQPDLQVRVTKAGLPLAGIKLDLLELLKGKRIGQATTDSAGTATFSAVAAGRYKIDVIDETTGQATRLAEFAVIPGHSQHVDVTT
jgi:hypothetical protein